MIETMNRHPKRLKVFKLHTGHWALGYSYQYTGSVYSTFKSLQMNLNSGNATVAPYGCYEALRAREES